MDPLTIMLLSGGLGLASNLIQGAGRKSADERQNKANLEAQKLANKHNVEFWRMQNEYNDPTQQMARLKAAGLNPHLVYGGSPGQVSGTAGQIAPSKAAPQRHQNLWEGIDLQKGFNQAMTAQQIDAQTQDAMASSRKKDQETLESAQRTRNWELVNEIKSNTKDAEISGIRAKYGMQELELEIKKETKDSQISAIKKENWARKKVAKLKGDLAEQGLTVSDDVLYRILVANPEQLEGIISKIPELPNTLSQMFLEWVKWKEGYNLKW